jgi:hypothetical protein
MCYNLSGDGRLVNSVRRYLKSMIWQVIKQSAIDIWDEMLYLLIFNVIWVLGTFLIIPWPFVTFGLFAVACDISQGKGIKFSTFFAHAGRMWKQAYIWGGINLAILFVLWVNFNFYSNLGTRWADFIGTFVLGLMIFWIIFQLIILPIYPRLEKPGFKLALHNATIVAARHPLEILLLVIIVVGIGVATLLLSAIAMPISFLITFSVIAVVANRLVETLIEQELKREAGG